MDLTAPKLVRDPHESWDDLTSLERHNIELALDYGSDLVRLYNDYNDQKITVSQAMKSEVFTGSMDIIIELKRENEVKSIVDLSPATRDGYTASFENLFKKYDESLEYKVLPVEEVSTKKNSYRQYKAAINHFIEKYKMSSLEYQTENFQRVLVSMLTILARPYLLPGVALNRKKPELALARKYDRKNEISGLSHEWQDVIFKNATQKMKPVLAVLEATGCRPEELEKGVELKRDGDDIYIRIQNAKISGYRDLRVQTNTASSRYLLNYIDEQSVKSLAGYEKLNYKQKLLFGRHVKNNVITIQKDKTNLSQYFRDKRKYLGEEFKNLTPYYYRYQKATDLMKLVDKKLIDESVVQQALGHLDKKTKLNYIANNVDRAVSSRVTFARISK
jgi:integrase